jgi:hypothetical protein
VEKTIKGFLASLDKTNFLFLPCHLNERFFAMSFRRAQRGEIPELNDEPFIFAMGTAETIKRFIASLDKTNSLLVAGFYFVIK